ncbi:PilZ domain-containing protein [Sneathiella marina]|uniref:PilZ domain-containing protein n=1 Tax=Sneathiella marina TaxID=2950108 RepID=A0ABY4W732_9PROT|nr:PilZ domain-containing protein [Sneathiella marina]USG61727.1 PilZ domain-containing protein [Sneathiella marina]
MIIAEDIKNMLKALEAENNHKHGGSIQDRVYPRRDGEWQATIRAEQGHECLHEAEREVSGVIKDISANGARIDVESSFFEKNNLILTISGQCEFRCDLVWRRGNKIGLQFSEDPKKVVKELEKVSPKIESIHN